MFTKFKNNGIYASVITAMVILLVVVTPLAFVFGIENESLLNTNKHYSEIIENQNNVIKNKDTEISNLNTIADELSTDLEETIRVRNIAQDTIYDNISSMSLKSKINYVEKIEKCECVFSYFKGNAVYYVFSDDTGYWYESKDFINFEIYKTDMTY